MQTTIKLAFSLFMAILLVTITSISVIVNQEVQAQRDTFKVIVYLNNVSYKTGDVDVWITLDSAGTMSSTGAINPMRYSSIGPFEFDASEIRVGETFSACVHVLSTGEINCVSGKNSPAKKLEVVYLRVPGQYYSLPKQSPPLSQPLQPSSLYPSYNWRQICSSIDPILVSPCNQLVNRDNTLTYEGQRAYECISNGIFLAGGGAVLLNLPLPVISDILRKLSTMTGCDGIVDWRPIDNLLYIISIFS
jgi:hypothetical protein